MAYASIPSWALGGYNPNDLVTGPGVSTGSSGGSSSIIDNVNNVAGKVDTAVNDMISSVGSAIAGQMATTGTNYTDMINQLLGYSEENSAFNAREAEKARDWAADQNKLAMQHSASEAQKTREWQEKLSNSAYQRATSDLVKAGLNPVLAAGGSPASTPGGATGQAFTGGGSSASADNSSGAIGNLFSSMLNSAASMKMQDKALQWNREQLEASKAMAQLQAQTQLATSQNALTASQISANAQMAAAGTSAAAQRYHADRTYAAQKYISDQNAELTRTQQDLQHGYNYDKMAQDRQIAYDTSLTGALNSFLNGLYGTDKSGFNATNSSGNWWRNTFGIGRVAKG